MRKWNVEVEWRYTSVDWGTVEVEAETSEEASALALELVRDDQGIMCRSEILDGDPYEVVSIEEIPQKTLSGGDY